MRTGRGVQAGALLSSGLYPIVSRLPRVAPDEPVDELGIHLPD